jgi:polysaccharide biosynthesis protein PslH
VNAQRPLRILMLAGALPYPPDWGAGIRNYEIVRFLAARHAVTLMAYATGDEVDKVQAFGELGAAVVTVELPAAARRLKRRAQLTSMFSARSYQLASMYSRAMQSEITRALTTGGFDLVLVEQSQMGQFDFGSGPARVLDEHDIGYELLRQYFQTERGLLRKMYNVVEFAKFWRQEQTIWQRFHGCILHSERERAIVGRRAPLTRTAVVPSGVSLERFKPDPATVTDPASLVFTGTMNFRPNIDAMTYFVRQILPRICAQRPEVVLAIVGARPPAEVARLAGPNVILTGRVPDVRPYLKKAAVVVVPVRIGSGTRMKVVEALAMGKAMVSTTLGSEGHVARPGEHYLVGDTPQAFAEQVLRLLADASLARALGQRGRQLIEEEYSWSSLLGRFEGFLRTVEATSPVASIDPHPELATDQRPAAG